MGRATSGVTGMKFRGDDQLLAMQVVPEGEDPYVFVVFETGMAKRTPVAQYRVQGRGGTGIKVAKTNGKGGDLVGALTVHDGDEVMVVMERGNVVRSPIDQVRSTGRDTAGVIFATPGRNDSIVAVARNPEATAEVEEELETAVAEAEAVVGIDADGADDVADATDAVPSEEAGADLTSDQPEPDEADEPGEDPKGTGDDA